MNPIVYFDMASAAEAMGLSVVAFGPKACAAKSTG
jgi:hypothetical protein